MEIQAVDTRKSQDEERARLLELRAEIAYHDDLYYREASPEISDADYDALTKELAQLEAAYPELQLEGRAARPGDDRSPVSEDALHLTPMLSLNKAYSKSELKTFYDTLSRKVGIEDLTFSVEPKIDGIAISVVYENGKFVRAVTRGDGTRGEDISMNALRIKGLPTALAGNDIPESIELRGEVFVKFEDFRRLNEKRLRDGESPFAHPRNVAAGSIKLNNADEVHERNLSIAFFGFGDYSPRGSRPVTQTEFLKRVENWGLSSIAEVSEASGYAGLLETVESAQEMRFSYLYPTDGTVVKLSSLELQEKLGVSRTAPYWAIAYKSVGDIVVTRLNGITLQVGRTGTVTPVAELEEVSLEGSSVERASLHNIGEIGRLDLRIGDHVFLKKAGQIIPQVVGVDYSHRKPNAAPFETPSGCPFCGEQFSASKSRGSTSCENQNCAERVFRKIVYYASPDSVAIDGLGEASIRKLIDNQTISGIADLYRLTADSIVNSGIGSLVGAERILDSIESSKAQPLWRIIKGLGLPSVGETRARRLATRFENLADFATLVKQDFDEGGRLHDLRLGQSVELEVLQYFAETQRVAELRGLIELGVLGKDAKSSHHRDAELVGKSFAFTGRMENFSRQEAAEIVRELGAQVRSEVNTGCDYLVVGESPGGKLRNARELGVRVLTETEFMEMTGF